MKFLDQIREMARSRFNNSKSTRRDKFRLKKEVAKKFLDCSVLEIIIESVKFQFENPDWFRMSDQCFDKNGFCDKHGKRKNVTFETYPDRAPEETYYSMNAGTPFNKDPATLCFPYAADESPVMGVMKHRSSDAEPSYPVKCRTKAPVEFLRSATDRDREAKPNSKELNNYRVAAYILPKVRYLLR